MRIALATIILLTFSAALQAQECPGTPALVAGECLSNQLNAAEAALAKNFNQLLSATPVNEPNQALKAKALLTESQKQWLAHRNTYCEYKGFVEGGAPSYKGVRKALCLVLQTKARSTELKAMRAQYE